MVGRTGKPPDAVLKQDWMNLRGAPLLRIAISLHWGSNHNPNQLLDRAEDTQRQYLPHLLPPLDQPMLLHRDTYQFSRNVAQAHSARYLSQKFSAHPGPGS